MYLSIIFNERIRLFWKYKKVQPIYEIIHKLMSYLFFWGEKGSFETENNYFFIAIQMQE